MNAKHTPGPWKVDGDFVVPKSSTPDGFGCHASGMYISQQYDTIGKSKDANSRLIAMSPELLDELKLAESVIRHAVQESSGRVNREIVGGWEYHANRIRDLIAKTTGG